MQKGCRNWGLSQTTYHHRKSNNKPVFLKNISQAWVGGGDHFINGVPCVAFGIDERYITGNARTRKSFLKMGGTVPYTVKKSVVIPLGRILNYSVYFGIQELLGPENAEEFMSEPRPCYSKPHSYLRIVAAAKKWKSYVPRIEAMTPLQFS